MKSTDTVCYAYSAVGMSQGRGLEGPRLQTCFRPNIRIRVPNRSWWRPEGEAHIPSPTNCSGKVSNRWKHPKCRRRSPVDCFRDQASKAETCQVHLWKACGWKYGVEPVGITISKAKSTMFHKIRFIIYRALPLPPTSVSSRAWILDTLQTVSHYPKRR